MADKTQTIKNATDKDLDALIVRLRKENTLQELVASLKRKSTPVDPYNDTQNYSYDRPEVSTEAPIASLYHYGILGMRWGVRRKRGPDGRVIPGTRKVSADHKTARQLKKDAPQGLSTGDLKTLNTRLQLEKQYNDLNPSDFKKGMQVAQAFTAAGTTVAGAYALVKTPLGQDIIKAAAKKKKQAG